MIVTEKKKQASDKLPKDKIVSLVNGLIKDGKYRNASYVVVGFCTGMRVSDILDWKWEHILETSNTFKTEFEILEQKTMKVHNRKTRTIIFNKTVIEILEKYWRSINCPRNGYIFSNEKGGRLTPRAIDYILKDANVEYLGKRRAENFSSHSLRKSFAWHFYNSNGRSDTSLHTLQRILGHSNINITLVYLGLMKKEIESAYNINFDLY